MNAEKVELTITNDQSDFSACARMMVRSDPWVTLGMGFPYCLRAFDGSCKEVYLLRLRRELLGFMILQVCGSFSGYIQTLFVREEDRGRGYGELLLRKAEERISKISPNVFICVSSFNNDAKKLYEKFGFELVGELKDFVKKGFSELLYRNTQGPLIEFSR